MDRTSEHELLTFVDAGKVAGVSHVTIRRWVKSGELKASPMPGSSRVRVRRSTLIQFINELEVSAKYEINEID